MTLERDEREAARAEAAKLDGPSMFFVNLICCGRDDGRFGPATWDKCEALRVAYVTSTHHGDHDRSAVIVTAVFQLPTAPPDVVDHVATGRRDWRFESAYLDKFDGISVVWRQSVRVATPLPYGVAFRLCRT